MAISDYVATREAAKIVGLSRCRILQLVNDGRLPAAKVGGAYLFHRAALASFAKTPRKAGRPKMRKSR